MTEDTDERDESTPKARHVESSGNQRRQDDPGTFHVAADDVPPVTKPQDSPVDVADSSSASEKYHFCPNCGTEAVATWSY